MYVANDSIFLSLANVIPSWIRLRLFDKIFRIELLSSGKASIVVVVGFALSIEVVSGACGLP